MLIDSFY